jgi:hypothetical protein
MSDDADKLNASQAEQIRSLYEQLDEAKAELSSALAAREKAEGERDEIHNGLDDVLGRFDEVLRAHAGPVTTRDAGSMTVIEMPALPWPEAVRVVIEHVERQRDEAVAALKAVAPLNDKSVRDDLLKAVRPHERESLARILSGVVSALARLGNGETGART